MGGAARVIHRKKRDASVQKKKRAVVRCAMNTKMNTKMNTTKQSRFAGRRTLTAVVIDGGL